MAFDDMCRRGGSGNSKQNGHGVVNDSEDAQEEGRSRGNREGWTTVSMTGGALGVEEGAAVGVSSGDDGGGAVSGGDDVWWPSEGDEWGGGSPAGGFRTMTDAAQVTRGAGTWGRRRSEMHFVGWQNILRDIDPITFAG